MPGRVIVFTSFTYADVARARALARSLRTHQPDWGFYGVLVDRAAPGGVEEIWRREFDVVLDAEALYGETWRRFVFKHDAGEACAAVKGRALTRLFAEGAEKAIYLSPEILVFDALDGIERRLDEASILLSPRQIEPNARAQAIADNEEASLRAGVFDPGFLAVRNDAAGAALARWWTARLDSAPGEGAFADAKFFDLAPALFEGVGVLREPGCGVASWNLSRRAIEIALDGRILVNGRHPLKFFHFAGDGGERDILTERYAGRQLAPYELWAYCRRALAAAGAPPAPMQAWAYGLYDDGSPIAYRARRLYRSDPEISARFADPFADGPDSFRAYLKASRPDLL